MAVFCYFRIILYLFDAFLSYIRFYHLFVVHVYRYKG